MLLRHYATVLSIKVFVTDLRTVLLENKYLNSLTITFKTLMQVSAATDTANSNYR